MPPKKHFKSSSETTYMCRKVKRLPRQRRERRQISEFVSVKNYRLPVSTSYDSRQNVQKRKNAWRRSSNESS